MMLTSGGHDDDVARCEELGIAAYLLKPIKQSELLDAIKLAIGITTPDEEASDATALHARRVGPLRILLAEDSLVNQKTGRGPVGESGDTRSPWPNHGREALAAMENPEIRRGSDGTSKMPEMDGLETTMAIRAKERQTGDHVPILAMTAHALRGDRERCIAAGMDGYLAKPIHAKELFDLIESLLPPSKAAGTGRLIRGRAPRNVARRRRSRLPPQPDGGGPVPLSHRPPRRAKKASSTGPRPWKPCGATPSLLRVVVDTAPGRNPPPHDADPPELCRRRRHQAPVACPHLERHPSLFWKESGLR